jgi:hypothetical protein
MLKKNKRRPPGGYRWPQEPLLYFLVVKLQQSALAYDTIEFKIAGTK